MHTNCTISGLTKGLNKQSKNKVISVFNYSKKHLSSLKRRTGETYFEHGCELALTLKEASKNTELLVSLLLHDLPLQKNGYSLLKRAPINNLEKNFIKKMVLLRRLHIDENTDDLDKVINIFTEDSRILLMRMAHRLNDIRKLCCFEPKLRKKIAHETLHIYTSLAGRIGLHAWRYEMEDICFFILHPRIAKNLKKKFDQIRKLDELSLKTTKRFIQKKLKEKSLNAKIHLRIKKLYSTYRKMIIKKRKFDELTDRLALRIIVPTINDCYLTLGLIHKYMHPIAGKLKDYIGAPKENGYQSIHTVVYPLPGVTEQPMEFQIRTPEMNWECEYGIAAHHEYKKQVYSLKNHKARVNLFRNLEVLKEESRSPSQFTNALRTYFQTDILVIFDHKNNLYHIKKPATALDFAFLVYKKRCTRLKKIKINGREQPLDTQLIDGDVVEIMFGRLRTYQRKWRSLCNRENSLKTINELNELCRKNNLAC